MFELRMNKTRVLFILFIPSGSSPPQKNSAISEKTSKIRCFILFILLIWWGGPQLNKTWALVVLFIFWNINNTIQRGKGFPLKKFVLLTPGFCSFVHFVDLMFELRMNKARVKPSFCSFCWLMGGPKLNKTRVLFIFLWEVRWTKWTKWTKRGF